VPARRQASLRQRHSHSSKGNDHSAGSMPRAPAHSFDLGMATSWLEIDQRPRLVLDGADRVLWCNAAASNGALSDGPLRIDGDRVVFASVDHAETARRLFRDADATVQRITLMSDAGNLEGIALGVWGHGEDTERRVFVKVSPLQPSVGAAQSGMARCFALTKAEAGVVDELLQVSSPAEVADRLGVSVHTIRTHIRRIYAKTGVRSHGQLIQLALVFCGG